MKKRLFITLINLIFISLLFIITFVFAHHDGVTGLAVNDVPENITGSGLIDKLEIDPSTGQPKIIVETEEKFEQLREQNASYLAKEWTKIFADNKFFGPFLFYTDKFFLIFNPFWKAVFKIEFSWTLTFVLSFIIWIIITVLVYYPVYGIFPNKLVDFIVSIIIASLIGIAGSIKKAIELADLFVKNIIILIIVIIIVVLLVVVYILYMRKLIKESGELALERSKEAIKAHGEVSRKALEEMGK